MSCKWSSSSHSFESTIIRSLCRYLYIKTPSYSSLTSPAIYNPAISPHSHLELKSKISSSSYAESRVECICCCLTSYLGYILLALINVTYIREYIQAAACPEAQAAIADAEALQLELSCPQINEAMTPMFNAEP